MPATRSPRTFDDLFGQAPTVTAHAPGRVNLVGEHTDYNGGFVLPMAIPQETRVELAPARGREVRAFSADVPGGKVERYLLGAERKRRGWLDYVQGVTDVLRRDGHELGGFDVGFTSAVPLGSGLSSSAALEVSLLRALREAFALRLDDVALALAGQRAEAEFVGAPVGVMDQLACSLADARSALFIDTRTLAYEKLPVPAEVEPLVVSSGVSHSHAGGDYRVRRAECERAARALGVEQLRDLTASDLPRALALPEPLGRRVRHVVTEDARVLAAVEALRTGDAARLGSLFDASHASQRDDYEVSIPEIDLLVSLARRDPDVLGARLTGGGFGGSIVALARASTGASAGRRLASAYHAASGRTARVLVPLS
jgi:galactokinase